MATATPISRLRDLQVFFTRMPADRLALVDSYEGELDMFGAPIPFSEPVAAFKHSRGRTLVVLILDGRKRIIRVALGHRGYSGGTGLSQVLLTDVVPTPNVRIGPYVAQVSKRFGGRIATAAESGGVLPPGASLALLGRLIDNHPEIRGVVALADRLSRNPIERLPEQQQQRLQQERDAGFTAMLIAGVDREAYLTRTDRPQIDGQRWFLDQVVDARVREDTMLANDSQLFPGFEEIERHVSGAIRLRGENTLLSILLINRQPLEELTGTDLIYYNETFDSFVMVQYKAMERERDDSDVFRLPNLQLAEEIARMHVITADMPTPGVANAPTEFRLNQGPFFLKFCPRLLQQPTEPALVPGMYFHLDHWEKLSADERLLGVRGGSVLRLDKSPPFTNADRYLNNSEFAALVRSGWIGTSTNQSSLIRDAIQLSLSRGKSVTLATAKRIRQAENHS